MLKAIGKLISVRVVSPHTRNIPLVVLGNSPITSHYEKKVDSLKSLGMIQGFLSLNPSISKEKRVVEKTVKKGFQTMRNQEDLESFLKNLIRSDRTYFSAMTMKSELGKIISLANNESSIEGKAEKFLKLLEGAL